MTFAHKGMAWQSFDFENLSALNSVADVGEVAMAVDIGGVAAEDADVVEHGGFIDKLFVDVEPALLNAFRGFPGDTLTMQSQHPVERC